MTKPRAWVSFVTACGPGTPVGATTAAVSSSRPLRFGNPWDPSRAYSGRSIFACTARFCALRTEMWLYPGDTDMRCCSPLKTMTIVSLRFPDSCTCEEALNQSLRCNNQFWQVIFTGRSHHLRLSAGFVSKATLFAIVKHFLKVLSQLRNSRFTFPGKLSGKHSHGVPNSRQSNMIRENSRQTTPTMRKSR